MAFLLGSLLFDAILAGLLLLGIVYYLGTCGLTYWKKKGVPTPEPEFFFGNMKEFVLQRRYLGHVMQDFYNMAKKNGWKYMGIYQLQRPCLVIADIDLVKSILLKDFTSFTDRGQYCNREGEPLTANLFNLEGAEWKALRSKLSPTFTSGKMKTMFGFVKECVHDLNAHLQEQALKGDSIEVKDIMARFTTDVISSCAFGLQSNSFKYPDSEFRKMGALTFKPTAKKGFLSLLAVTMPNFRKKIPINHFDPAVEKFFMRVVRETVEYREKNNVKRHDFVDLLLQIKNKGRVMDEKEDDSSVPHAAESGIDVRLLPAQAFVFFLAGFETSSSALSFCLLELSQQPEIQERLREEVDRVWEQHKDLTYDAIQDLTYMDQVLQETMRLYPALGSLTRHSTKKYEMPDGVQIEKDTRVFVPCFAIHRDPEFYPNPEHFDPERFSEEGKQSRPNYTYMPFGEGPRLCIGMRFAYMQMKTGLATLMRNYTFELDKEHTIMPVKFIPSSFVTSSVGGTWLHIKKRARN